MMMQIPTELFEEILFRLNFKEFQLLGQVNKQLNDLTNRDELLKKVIYKIVAFNPEDWITYFGSKVDCVNDQILAHKSLPDDIGKIIKSNCPLFPGKKLGETHLITWMPADLTTVDFCSILTDRFLVDNKKLSLLTSSNSPQELNSTSLSQPSWIIMSKYPIPGSLDKSFSMQEDIIASVSSKLFKSCSVPKTIEAIVSMSTHFFKTGNIIFENEYTRCQESFANESQTIVGFTTTKEWPGDQPNGLYVDRTCTNLPVLFFGLASLFKL